jgi:hypothetical protein
MVATTKKKSSAKEKDSWKLHDSNLCLVLEFPKYKEDGNDHNHGIWEHERRDVPSSWQKHSVSTDERHDEGAGECVITGWGQRFRISPPISRKRNTNPQNGCQKLLWGNVSREIPCTLRAWKAEELIHNQELGNMSTCIVKANVREGDGRVIEQLWSCHKTNKPIREKKNSLEAEK